MNRAGWLASLAGVAISCSGCALVPLGVGTVGEPDAPPPPGITAGTPSTAAGTPSPTVVVTSPASPSAAASGLPATTPTPSVVTVAVVGDMDCQILCPKSADVGALVESLHPDAFMPPGDTLNNTADWSVYDADWGALKDVTYPVVGNHEYSAGIDAYDSYWGAAAHAPDHYYSFDLGSWHVVALNSEIDTTRGSPQETWFQADLAAHPAACTMVVVHGLRWSSSIDHPSDDSLQALWDDAVGHQVELWLSGHAHLYERFAALDSDGLPYDQGTTEFVIGTGGRQLHRLAPEPETGEVVRDNDTYGAGLFALGDGTWSMRFVPIPEPDVPGQRSQAPAIRLACPRR